MVFAELSGYVAKSGLDNRDEHESTKEAMLCHLRSHHVGEIYDHQ